MYAVHFFPLNSIKLFSSVKSWQNYCQKSTVRADDIQITLHYVLLVVQARSDDDDDALHFITNQQNATK